ncbi:MAG: amidohydrolase family protein [Candidatus Acidiferrales bacterium]
MRKALLMAAASVAILLAGFAFPRRNSVRADVPGAQASAQNTETAKLLEGFAAIEPIDTHTHAFHNDPAFAAMLTRLHLHLLDIIVADDHNIFRSLVTERASARAFIAGTDGHAILCTTFDPFSFEKPGFAGRAIQQINDDFSRGAVAVKIWKNIGMEIKKTDGTYVMPDDPIFEPIYQDIAAHHKTLIAHLAEPSSCWEPPNPQSPDYSYYKENPQWYMYLHPDHPSKQTILSARDHLLEMNPKLRVVGAHLGSMETDLDEIAAHFDRYPNFAVDTAARMEYLMIQPREKARAFLIKYQDRVLYGTDSEFLVNESAADALKDWQDTYARDWKFLATDEMLDYHGRKIEGLKLPPSVLKKIFHDNAVQWIPGILGPGK